MKQLLWDMVGNEVLLLALLGLVAALAAFPRTRLWMRVVIVALVAAALACRDKAIRRR